jgi:hypothetical protein
VRLYSTLDQEGAIQLFSQLAAWRLPPAGYDADALLDCFLYSESGLAKYYEQEGEPPPGFAIYTHATLDSASPPRCNTDRVRTPNRLHILHTIPLALDSNDRADYRYFIEGNRYVEVGEYYGQLFATVLACARDLNITRILMPMVGATELAVDRREFQATFWLPVLQSSRQGRPVDITLLIAPEQLDPAAAALANQYEIALLDPAALRWDRLGEDVLLVNSLDPERMIGNQNCAGRSLDAEIGSRTNSLVLGSPWFNDYFPNRVTLVPMPASETF